jgi:excisionase family DNA binding protein
MTVPLTMTVEEAGRLLGIGRGLAYEAARKGDIPTIRLGRRLLVPRARLLELLGEPVEPAAGRDGG